MYSLLLVDKKCRYKLVYPLQNLTSDLLSQLKQFLIDVDGCCKAIRSDFDHKLPGGNVKAFLLDKGIDIDATPPRQQHKNRLVERSWQGIVKLSRNWLASACLPPDFWWFAIKRVTEVSNILPTFHLSNSRPATPFELFFDVKPDLRTLIPMFSVAWVHRPTSNKFQSRSLKCILFGRDSHSNGLIYYHPPSKTTFVDGNEYRLDLSSVAGPAFKLDYEGSFHSPQKRVWTQSYTALLLSRKTNQSSFYQPEIITRTPALHESVNPTTDPFVVQLPNGDITQVMASDIKESGRSDPPSVDPINPSAANAAISWIKHDAKATFYHPTLGPQPKWGRILCDSSQPIESAWSFVCGKHGRGKRIVIPNLCENTHNLIGSSRLTRGWKNR